MKRDATLHHRLAGWHPIFSCRKQTFFYIFYCLMATRSNCCRFQFSASRLALLTQTLTNLRWNQSSSERINKGRGRKTRTRQLNPNVASPFITTVRPVKRPHEHNRAIVVTARWKLSRLPVHYLHGCAETMNGIKEDILSPSLALYFFSPFQSHYFWWKASSQMRNIDHMRPSCVLIQCAFLFFCLFVCFA